MPFGRRSPLETLALPGVILAYKYSQFRQRRREAASRRVTERELSALHHKIDKLLSKLEESEPEPPTSQEDECVICINARATMQTSPCGHRVVCRRCFVKTIQSAVAQRLLPLRCVICRARVNRLISGSGTWRIQESASNYSVGTSKSWSTPGTSGKISGIRVTQSASLYSMSSGSSNVSGISTSSNRSNSSGASCTSNTSGTSGMSSTSLTSKSSTETHHHRNHESCGSHCLGAIPRNPQYLQNQKAQQQQQQQQLLMQQQQYLSGKRPGNRYANKIRLNDIQNRLPPIKEFRSPTKVPITSSSPRLRFASYTAQKSKSASSTSSLDTVPLLSSAAPVSSSSQPSTVSKLGMTAKVAPIKKPITPNTHLATPSGKHASDAAAAANNMPSTSHNSYFAGGKGTTNTNTNKAISKTAADDKMAAENKKNESSAERRKKEEKLRQKAEKEARKEEKRLAKEAKLLAKEEKKRSKKDVKYFSLLCDNNKTDSKTKK